MTKLSMEKLQSLLAKIPRGKVVTYKELARAMGSKKATRAVGTLCGKNPQPNKYPCYKVVKSDGRVTTPLGLKRGKRG